MAPAQLSQRDINVLGKIRDPEHDPSLLVRINSYLPYDPSISESEYIKVTRKEYGIIGTMEKLEAQKAEQRPGQATKEEIIREYRSCVSELDDLIEHHPRSSSLRNNRAQALRRLYGDSMLLPEYFRDPQALLPKFDDRERQKAAKTALGDLDLVIRFLTPKEPQFGLSPKAAKTLANAHTQRAAIYLRTSKLLGPADADCGWHSASVDAEMPEAAWSKLDFEERASKDFAMGGRYGNEIARALAVATNPTAKLCGQMVQEAMKKEYGPGPAP